MMYTARAGKVTFVQEWIKRGAYINTVDKRGRNILLYCCGGGEFIPNQAEVRNTFNDVDTWLLIEKDVNCFTVDKAGITPIRYFVDLSFDKCILHNTSDPSRAMQIWEKEKYENVKMLSNLSKSTYRFRTS